MNVIFRIAQVPYGPGAVQAFNGRGAAGLRFAPVPSQNWIDSISSPRYAAGRIRVDAGRGNVSGRDSGDHAQG